MGAQSSSTNKKIKCPDINLIKCPYIIKLIFSHLDIKKTLTIVKHNKKLLQKLDYNVDNYKNLAEREIIIGKKGKGNGKEYIIDSKILLFEGKYLNRKRNGFGKEYYINGQLKSEGNYLKGLKHGKFKEYYGNGKLKFDGEYKSNKKMEGIEYNALGEIKSENDNIEDNKDSDDNENYDYDEQECKSDDIEKYNNYGLIDEDKIKFEGIYYKKEKINGRGYNYINGLIIIIENRKGKEFYDNGKIRFEGEYLNNKRWNGIMYDYNGKKEFELKNGKGKGKEYDSYGELIYEGEFINGERNGKGKKYIFSDKLLVGEFLDGKLNGKVKQYYKEKLTYEGEYLDDKKNGYGKYYNSIDKDYNHDYILLYEGEYLDGHRWNGKGKEYYFPVSDKLYFDGEYYKGKKWNGKIEAFDINEIYEIKNGKGNIVEYKSYYSDPYDSLDYYKSYEGEYENGMRNGKGKEYKYYDPKNTCDCILFIWNVYEGEFLNGKKNGKGKEYYNNNLSFEGEYLNGKRNGKGKEYENNKIIFEGEYLNGERWEGKYYQFTDSTKKEVKLNALYQKGIMVCVK